MYPSTLLTLPHFEPEPIELQPFNPHKPKLSYPRGLLLRYKFNSIIELRRRRKYSGSTGKFYFYMVALGTKYFHEITMHIYKIRNNKKKLT